MDWHRFVFHSQWRVAAHPDRVYDALVDVGNYPTWWPQVHAARELGDGSGELRCRSLLPYDLVFLAHREIQDPVGRVLRARLEGDLCGSTQWTIAADGAASVAVFDEDVTVGKSLVRAAGLLARPALRFNHDLMMRSGERGLRRLLAST